MKDRGTSFNIKLRMRNQNIFLLRTILLILGHTWAFTTENDYFRSTRKSLFAADSSDDHLIVAVTREDGKNEKLINAVRDHATLAEKVDIVELPCIEHATGPDIDILEETLKSKHWDYVAVTSPEAAKVVASAWDVVRDDPIPVAAVGKATEQALKKFGISVAFVPSKATAKTLVAELDRKAGEGTTLLYPASAKAKDVLENGLIARGFEVTRLNTYDTVTANWTDEQKAISQRVRVACFASPSSINGWLANTDNNKEVLVACIGETSANACTEFGWDKNQIFFPESPGIDGWVESIQEASSKITVAHT